MSSRAGAGLHTATGPLALALKQPDPPGAGWMYASIIPSVSIRKNVF